MELTEEKIGLYRRHIRQNWPEMKQSVMCGCLSCGKVYPANEVEDYIGYGDEELTAICTYCLEETLVGDASGLDISAETLQKVKQYHIED